VTDECRVEEVLRKHRPAAVLHLAAMLSGRCEQDRSRGWRVNADGTFRMLDLALRGGVNQFLFSSTVAAFGGSLPNPLPDDAPQWPDGLYGVTKVLGERLGVYYHRRHGLDFRCVRFPITVSPFAAPGAASALASQAFIKGVRTGRFTFAARPDTPLALVYAQDAVRALAQLLAAPAERLTRRVYNIHAMTVTPRQIAAAIRDRLPRVEIDFVPDPSVADLLASWPGTIDDAPAQADWGWRPDFDLERTATAMIEEVQHLPAQTR
jgi:threonine 3-dehydrogenase